MPVSAEQILTALALPGVGRRTVTRAAESAVASGDDSAFWSCVFERKSGLGPAALEQAARVAREHVRRAEDCGIAVVTYVDAEYPPRLRSIEDPPACLFVKGQHGSLTGASAVAVVGTREPTTFAQNSARSVSKLLASEGAVIVSGLAKGCDTLAHEGCLEAGGVTVAVMAHGLDRVYPAENRGLADRILGSGGTLVSEYPVGQAPTRNSFVDRDRLQSGLSDAVLVIETSESGGTMHTARFAVKQRRVLAAVDHPEAYAGDDQTSGNKVIKRDMGGVPVQGRDDLRALHGLLISSLAALVSAAGTEAVRCTDPQSITGQSPSQRIEFLRSLGDSILGRGNAEEPLSAWGATYHRHYLSLLRSALTSSEGLLTANCERGGSAGGSRATLWSAQPGLFGEI